MFPAEAEKLCALLAGRDDVSPLLNLGSSTGDFRLVTKPHIEASLFAPLRRAGVEVVHCDIKQDEGVDLVGDVTDPAFADMLAARHFRAVLLANLLEHVRDRTAIASACERIAGPGGLILATVPQSYPFHADPIDTGYRPSPQELAALFPGSEPIYLTTIEGGTLGERLRAQGRSAWREILSTAMWLLISPARPRTAAAKLHRWRWFRRPFRVSIALLRVRGTA